MKFVTTATLADPVVEPNDAERFGADRDAVGEDRPAPAVADGAPRPASRPLYRAAMFVAPAVGLVVFFTVWEIYVRVADVRRLVLAAPSSTLRHLVGEPGFYWRNAQITMKEAAVGFAVALLAALLVATLMAHLRFVERATMPVIIVLQSTPVAVLAPVFLIWFGFSSWPKILVAAIFAFIPFVFNAFTGLRAVDPDTYELMQSVSATRWEIFWKLRLPYSLPYLFSAARICVGLSLVGAVIGEMYGGSTGGLGNAARIAQTRVLVDQLWGSIFVLALIGVAGNLVLAAIEARVLRWHSSQSRRRRR